MENFWAHDAVHGGHGVGLVLVHGDEHVLAGHHVLAVGGGILASPGLPTGQIGQALPTDRVSTAYWSGSASTAHWLLVHRMAVVGAIRL